jgi:hypothetical protein
MLSPNSPHINSFVYFPRPTVVKHRSLFCCNQAGLQNMQVGGSAVSFRGSDGGALSYDWQSLLHQTGEEDKEMDAVWG